MKSPSKMCNFFWSDLHCKASVFSTHTHSLSTPTFRAHASAIRQQDEDPFQLLPPFYRLEEYALSNYRYQDQFPILYLSWWGWPVDWYEKDGSQHMSNVNEGGGVLTLSTMPWATSGFFKMCWPRSLLKMGPKALISSAALAFLVAFAVNLGMVV